MATKALEPSESAAIASLSSVISAAATASRAAASQIAELDGSKENERPASFKIIGVVLAVGSGLFIGTSFVFKKKGLLNAQKGLNPSQIGESHAYLKNWLWWLGMTLMVIGEILNFVAYAFVDAILVTPLGAISVVVSAILSSIFLKEKLTLFGKVGCFLCIVGSTIICLNGPEEQGATTILAFRKLFLAPGFLVFGSTVIVVSLLLIFFVAPKYGKQNMMVYISICSLIGGLSVVCTTGLGAAIVTSIGGNNQFKEWFIYFLLGFVIITLLAEINYLNKALELYNTAVVTPVYYTLFTFCVLVSSAIINQGFKAPVVDIISVVLGFLTICAGIALLQMSKMDPESLKGQAGLDRRSTMLLAVQKGDIEDSEKHTEIEDPGMDTVRGGAGIIGSIYRARSMNKTTSGEFDQRRRTCHRRKDTDGHIVASGTVERHQLYDAPMTNYQSEKGSIGTKRSDSIALSPLKDHVPTIGFSEDVTSHRYPTQGDARSAIHEHAYLDDHHHQQRRPSNTSETSRPQVRHQDSAASDASTSTIISVGARRAEPTSYSDPFATSNDFYWSSPRSAQSDSEQTSAATKSLSKKLGGFQNTLDLSIMDPRQKQTSKRSIKSLLSPTSPGKKFTRRGSKDDTEEERSHLVQPSADTTDESGHLRTESEDSDNDLGREMKWRS